MKAIINASALKALTTEQALEVAKREHSRHVGIETEYGKAWIVTDGGNARERERVADAILAADRRANEPNVIAAGPAPATQRQRDYLVHLIAEDQGAATGFGVAQGLPESLSKREASRLIDKFLKAAQEDRECARSDPKPARPASPG